MSKKNVNIRRGGKKNGYEVPSGLRVERHTPATFSVDWQEFYTMSDQQKMELLGSLS